MLEYSEFVLSAEHILFIGVGTTLGAVLRAFTGFGLALAALPIFVFVLQPVEAVTLVVFLSFMANLIRMPSFWNKQRARSLLPIVSMAVIGTALGIFLLGHVNLKIFQMTLGLFIIVACLLLQLVRPNPAYGKKSLMYLTGLSSGVLNGVFASPGPPIIIYKLATQSSAAENRADFMTYFLFTAGFALLGYALTGYFTFDVLIYAMVAVPFLIVGELIGSFLFKAVDKRVYRRVGIILLFSIGIFSLVKGMII
jgi:uncharacterized membrane protein YfcA